MMMIEKGFPDEAAEMLEPDRDLCTVRLTKGTYRVAFEEANRGIEGAEGTLGPFTLTPTVTILGRIMRMGPLAREMSKAKAGSHILFMPLDMVEMGEEWCIIGVKSILGVVRMAQAEIDFGN